MSEIPCTTTRPGPEAADTQQTAGRLRFHPVISTLPAGRRPQITACLVRVQRAARIPAYLSARLFSDDHTVNFPGVYWARENSLQRKFTAQARRRRGRRRRELEEKHIRSTQIRGL